MTARAVPLILTLLAGCDDHLLGESEDTGGGAAYTADWAGVQQFFTDECVVCHRDGGSAGFDMATVIEQELTDGDPSTDYFVVPGDSASSVLWQSLSFSGAAQQMPQGAIQPLPDSEIGHVKEWIDNGASL